ncbi:hypothetical protein [Haliangium sp.]
MPRLMLSRLVDARSAGADADTWGVLEELAAETEPGTWLLSQPPERSEVWVIAASGPMWVTIERPLLRGEAHVEARAWEDARADILAWIERGGELPVLPPRSAALALGLRADRAVGSLLERYRPEAPGFRRAVRAWRAAAALTRLELVGPRRQPWHWSKELTGALAEGVSGPSSPVSLQRGLGPNPLRASGRAYARFDANDTGTLDLTGPGVLELDVRAVVAGDAAPTAIEVVLEAGARRLARVTPPHRQAWVSATEPAGDRAVAPRVPLGVDDETSAGPRRRVRVPLFPGRHTYAITAQDGPALIRARTWTRRPRLAEVLTRRRASADWLVEAEASLGGDDSPEAAVLRVLIATLRGAPALPSIPTEDCPPALAAIAAVATWHGYVRQAQPPVPEPDTVRGLAEGVAQLIDRESSGADAVALAWLLRGAVAAVAGDAGLGEVVLGLAPAAVVHGAGDGSKAVANSPYAGTEVPPLFWAALAHRAQQLAGDHRDPASVELARWAVQAAQAAWQRAPYDTAIRQIYRRVWHQTGAWSQLPRDPASEQRLPRYRYLQRPRPGDDEHATAAADAPPPPGALFAIPLGQRHRVVAPPSPVDHRRPVILRAHVATPDDALGALQMQVDTRVLHALPLAPLETFAVAVSPGTHEVTVDGPAGTEAYLSLAPADPGQAARPARLRWLRGGWSGGVAGRFDVPEFGRGLPVRLSVRVPPQADGGAIELAVRTDDGSLRRLSVHAPAADPGLLPLDGGGSLSTTVRVVLWLPPQARQVWVEPRDPSLAGTLWASIAMRWQDADPNADADPNPDAPAPAAEQAPADTPDPAAPPARTWSPEDPEWAAIVAQIAALSRELLAHPDRADLHLRRAHLLLDIDEPGFARLDQRALASLAPTPADEAERERLAYRFANWYDRDYLPVPPRPLDGPLPLSPPSMALASADAFAPWLEIARTVRHRGDRAPLYAAARRRDTPLARYYRAEALLAQGAARQAGELLWALYEHSAAPQLGVSAVEALAAAVAAEAGDAPALSSEVDGRAMLYGRARELREHIALPELRRQLLDAARGSEWEPVYSTNGNAGFERVYVDEELVDPDPTTILERALAAPPWPREQARLMGPGRATALALALSASARLTPSVWCARVQAAPASGPPLCRVRWRVDGKPTREALVPAGQATALAEVALDPGRHQIDVSLSDDDPSLHLAVRFASARPLTESPRGGAGSGSVAIPVRRPGRLYVADDTRPVELTVLGPTTLRVEARRYHEAPPVTVAVEAAGDTRTHRRRVVVDGPVDPSVSGEEQRALALSQASTTLLVLPAEDVYRIRLGTENGQALVRLWRRRDLPAGERARPAPAQISVEPAPMPEAPVREVAAWLPVALGATAPGATLVAERGISPWPTMSLGVGLRRDDLEERDQTDEPLEHRLQVDAAWRRQLLPNRVWLRIEPSVRWHPGLSPAYGSRVDLSLRRLPLKLRVDGFVRAYAQSGAGDLAWTAHARARVGRLWRLAPTLTLVPGLVLRARWYAPGAVADEAVFDPLVSNRYDRAHRLGLTPEASLYWRPLLDGLGLARARVVSNEDLASVDRAELTLAWRGIVDWSAVRAPRFEVRYRPGYRFADADRSSGYVRHDLGFTLDWSVWSGTAGRLLIELQDDVYLSASSRNRNVLSIGIRYDMTGGRGLRDMLPGERRFDALIEPRPTWGD